MVLGKICKYYQNSKCLLKRTYCDLLCSQMKYYGEDELDRLEEETSRSQKNLLSHSKREDPIGFLWEASSSIKSFVSSIGLAESSAGIKQSVSAWE